MAASQFNDKSQASNLVFPKRDDRTRDGTGINVPLAPVFRKWIATKKGVS
jgi:hypothetical protein